MRIGTDTIGSSITALGLHEPALKTTLSGLSQGPQCARIAGTGSLETNASIRPLQIRQKPGQPLLKQPVGCLGRLSTEVRTVLRNTAQACKTKITTDKVNQSSLEEAEQQARLEGEILDLLSPPTLYPFERPRRAPVPPKPQPAGLAKLINKVAPPVTRKLQKKPPPHASLETQLRSGTGLTSSSWSVSTDNDTGRMRTMVSRFTPDFKAQLKHFWKRDRHDA